MRMGFSLEFQPDLYNQRWRDCSMQLQPGLPFSVSASAALIMSSASKRYLNSKSYISGAVRWVGFQFGWAQRGYIISGPARPLLLMQKRQARIA